MEAIEAIDFTFVGPTMQVREARPSDQTILHELNVELQEFERGAKPSRRSGTELPKSYVTELLERAGSGRAKCFIAETDNKVIGFLACSLGEDPLEQQPLLLLVTDVIITADWRGYGAGRALFAAAEKFATESGAGVIRVSTLAGNQGSRRAYERLGFREAAIRYERVLDAKAPEAKTAELKAADPKIVEAKPAALST